MDEFLCISEELCPISLSYAEDRHKVLNCRQQGFLVSFTMVLAFGTCCHYWRQSFVELYRLPIESRVYMADGLPILIEFDSASTAAEVK